MSKVYNYDCRLCNEPFPSWYARSLHESSHADEKPYKCGICPLQFAKHRDLLEHHSSQHCTATEKRRLKCDLCDKMFQTVRELGNHRRGHTGEKPFGCFQCLKRLTSKSHFHAHL